MSRRLTASVGLAIGLLVSRPAFASSPWEGAWIEVHSPNFTILSALEEAPTTALAVELENFRRAVGIFTNAGEIEERIPTSIVVLRDSAESLGVAGGITGRFIPGMRANHAVIQRFGTNNDEIIKHEYTHFILRNHDDRQYPRWYHEGFAEMLSTLRVDGARIEYGNPVPLRVDWLQHYDWLSFSRVIGAGKTYDFRSGMEVMMFYAQSWLLVHYLMNGRPGSDLGAQMTRYLSLVESGSTHDAAFTRGFGIPPSRLRAELLAYRRQLPVSVLKMKQPFPAVVTQTRSVPRDEIAMTLGFLALEVAGSDAAQRYFEAALAANPHNARALVGSGDVHKFEGRFDEARPFYERAIALEPDDYENELDFAEYYLDRARKAYEDGDGQQLLVEARRHFFRSSKLAPDNPEMLAMNGDSYLFPGQDSAKAVASLEAAAALLPSNERIRLLLAKAYIAAGSREAARQQLNRLAAWAHPKDSEEIEKLLRSLDTPAPDTTADPKPGVRDARRISAQTRPPRASP